MAPGGHAMEARPLSQKVLASLPAAGLLLVDTLQRRLDQLYLPLELHQFAIELRDATSHGRVCGRAGEDGSVGKKVAGVLRRTHQTH